MTIKASNKLTDLTGIGTEFLVSDDGVWVRLEFYNGNIVRTASQGNKDDTIIG